MPFFLQSLKIELRHGRRIYMSFLFIFRGPWKKRFCGTFVEWIVTLFYTLPPPTRLLFFFFFVILKCRELKIRTFSVHLWQSRDLWSLNPGKCGGGQRGIIAHCLWTLMGFSRHPATPEARKSQFCVYIFKIVSYSCLREFMKSLSFFW